jgi:hypothetical protein
LYGTWQGRENARVFLQEHPAMMAELEQKMMARVGVQAGAPTSSSAAAEGAEASAEGANGAASDSRKAPRPRPRA